MPENPHEPPKKRWAWPVETFCFLASMYFGAGLSHALWVGPTSGDPSERQARDTQNQ